MNLIRESSREMEYFGENQQKRKFKRLKRTMLIIAAALLGLFVISIMILIIYSPGKPLQFSEMNPETNSNSISEKIFIEIGGLNQGMFIRGKNRENSIILFLHGGPGMPTYFLNEKYPTGLENHFTVCYWEQTGAGISYDPDLPVEEISVDKIISDAIEVTNYLRSRFKQDKIYLMGHSWGSFIGIRLAKKAPELFRAYVGVAQVTNQSESERIAYQYMESYYRASGNEKMHEKLLTHQLTNFQGLLSYFKSPLRDEAMHELGIGTMRTMRSVISGIFIPFMKCGAYTLSEKINLWRAKYALANKTCLIDHLLSSDLSTQILDFEIPVYFLCGSYDYTVNYGISKEYFNKISAPGKGFYTFKNSAHSPMHEEPGFFEQIMKEDIKKGLYNLADIN